MSPLFGLHTLLQTHTKSSRSNEGLPGGPVVTTCKPQLRPKCSNIVSEYDQEIPQSQTADNP